jgi:hypothetical protein
MAVVVALVVSERSVALGLAAGLVSYGVLLFVLRGIDRSDLLILRLLFGGAGKTRGLESS